MRKMKGNIPNDLMEKMLSPENLNAWNDSAILPFDDNIPQNFENASEDGSDNADGLLFSLEEYSENEQEDIVAVLRPFIGRNIDMEPGKYREYLKEKGILIPDGDADVFFRMAIRENDRAARERANKLRDQWIYENFSPGENAFRASFTHWRMKSPLASV